MIVRKIAASVSSALGRVGEKLAAICVIVLLMFCLFLQVTNLNYLSVFYHTHPLASAGTIPIIKEL